MRARLEKNPKGKAKGKSSAFSTPRKFEVPEARRLEIYSLLKARGHASISELALHLDTSEETVRRDLAVLHEAGFLEKVYGGAVLHAGVAGLTLGRRKNAQFQEKQAIAKAARALFPAGASMFIDAGSTTEIFGEEIASAGPYSIVTNSLTVARTMWQQGGHSIVLLGGEMRFEVEQTLGPMVIDQLKQFGAKYAVLTVTGISKDGFLTRMTVEETLVARTMIERAEIVILLIDSAKIGLGGMMNICDLSMVDQIVTDKKLDQHFADLMEKHGVVTIVADAKQKGNPCKN